MYNLILHLYAHTWAYIHECIHASIHLLCPSHVIVLASLCLQHLQQHLQLLPTLLCDGMCLAAASRQSKNGLLVTLPPSQPVAGLRLHHLQLLPAVAQLWCLMVEMRLAAASWQSKNCLLRGGCAVLEWAVSFQTLFHTVPYPFQTWTTHVPPLTHPVTGLKLSGQLHMVASDCQWVTLATGCVLSSARALAMQGKPALNIVEQVYNKDVAQMRSENQRQPAWVASTFISLRCIVYTFHIYIYTVYIYIYIYIYIYV